MRQTGININFIKKKIGGFQMESSFKMFSFLFISIANEYWYMYKLPKIYYWEFHDSSV